MKKPKKKYIHVNQHKIRSNKKHGTNEPVITIKEEDTIEAFKIYEDLKDKGYNVTIK